MNELGQSIFPSLRTDKHVTKKYSCIFTTNCTLSVKYLQKTYFWTTYLLIVNNSRMIHGPYVHENVCDKVK